MLNTAVYVPSEPGSRDASNSGASGAAISIGVHELDAMENITQRLRSLTNTPSFARGSVSLSAIAEQRLSIAEQRFPLSGSTSYKSTNSRGSTVWDALDVAASPLGKSASTRSNDAARLQASGSESSATRADDAATVSSVAAPVAVGAPQPVADGPTDAEAAAAAEALLNSRMPAIAGCPQGAQLASLSHLGSSCRCT